MSNMLSFKENIPIILEVVNKKNPHKILDIGAGMGKYGLLLREQYLSEQAQKHIEMPIDNIIIDAVEDTEFMWNFRGGSLFKIYNTVHQKSVFDNISLFEKEKYDIALIIDVIEHWTKENALYLIREIIKYTDVLISTPIRPSMYKDHYYGDSRHHITRWHETDFAEFSINIYSNKLSHIIYINKTPMTKGLVYYTNNTPEEKIFSICQKQLLKCMAIHKFPIYSISQKPIDFGINIVMDLKSSVPSMFKQILRGIEECKTDIIYLIEHDVLYHPSHFNFIPEKDCFYYNRNEWRVSSVNGKAVWYEHNDVSQLCAYRDLLLEHYRKVVGLAEKGEYRYSYGFSPPKGLPREKQKGYYKTFMSEFPNLDIRHKNCFTEQRMDKSQFRSERSCRGWKEADEVPYWGKTRGRFYEFLDEI